jgi:hypothetical protein
MVDAEESEGILMIGPVWWLTLNSLLIFVILVGGFFMFRAFLRRLKPGASRESTENRADIEVF